MSPDHLEALTRIADAAATIAHHIRAVYRAVEPDMPEIATQEPRAATNAGLGAPRGGEGGGGASTTLTIPFHPKTIREALCVAEGATLRHVTDQDLHGAPEVLAALIRECDRHRPLGPNGKHGQLHTATCGSDDIPDLDGGAA